jgi:hypothetical protein
VEQFHRVEGTLCLVRHGQAALSGSKTKAPGFAGGYLLGIIRLAPDARTEAYSGILQNDVGDPEGNVGSWRAP